MKYLEVARISVGRPAHRGCYSTQDLRHGIEYHWDRSEGLHHWGCYSTQDLGHGIKYHWDRFDWDFPEHSWTSICTTGCALDLVLAFVSLTRHENLSTRLTIGWIYPI